MILPVVEHALNYICLHFTILMLCQKKKRAAEEAKKLEEEQKTLEYDQIEVWQFSYSTSKNNYLLRRGPHSLHYPSVLARFDSFYQVTVKATIVGWTQKPTSTPAFPKMRTVPELLGALPELLGGGGITLPQELTTALKTLCNISPPSDVSEHTTPLGWRSYIHTFRPAVHCIYTTRALHDYSCSCIASEEVGAWLYYIIQHNVLFIHCLACFHPFYLCSARRHCQQIKKCYMKVIRIIHPDKMACK